ncbi:3-hydroxyacyl-CoA dehydrogenase family protein [Desertibaculum subflavum]|uniref:3-hydroxyacyl-CoA dehydrogenase family protein n=1 Tax=Desertibaculum subflavum TaxID=2268458 RepID=UPI000E66F358
MPVPAELKTVAVIGNGIIGHGVAQVFAMAGRKVVMIGRSEASLAAAVEKIGAGLQAFRAHGLLDEAGARAAAARVSTATDLGRAGGAELVIEAVTEELALKHRIFEQLDQICAPPVVLASSSGQPASALVARVKRRERVVAAHFWYPPQLIPLVEVCAGPETDPAVVPWVCAELKAAGKQPVVIDKEVPGFIGNRLQFALLREAWALWASGAASAEAIDAVVRHSFGRRLAVTGPIESADVGGLDTMVAFARFLDPTLDTSKEPPKALDDLVAAGHRGLPSGRGVYDWKKRDGKALLDARMAELFRWLAADRGG